MSSSASVSPTDASSLSKQIEEIAQGRVWLGNDALKIKLVDEIGGLDKAIEKAASLAKVSKYHATSYPEEQSWWEQPA